MYGKFFNRILRKTKKETQRIYEGVGCQEPRQVEKI